MPSLNRFSSLCSINDNKVSLLIFNPKTLGVDINLVSSNCLISVFLFLRISIDLIKRLFVVWYVGLNCVVSI